MLAGKIMTFNKLNGIYLNRLHVQIFKNIDGLLYADPVDLRSLFCSRGEYYAAIASVRNNEENYYYGKIIP